jgi:hypothetical protein
MDIMWMPSSYENIEKYFGIFKPMTYTGSILTKFMILAIMILAIHHPEKMAN